MDKKSLGITLAATAALAFVSAPISSVLAQAVTKQIECYGVNSCKGKRVCQTATSQCKGNNSCKGKGVLMMKSAKECKDKGGTTVMPKV